MLPQGVLGPECSHPLLKSLDRKLISLCIPLVCVPQHRAVGPDMTHTLFLAPLGIVSHSYYCWNSYSSLPKYIQFEERSLSGFDSDNKPYFGWKGGQKYFLCV